MLFNSLEFIIFLPIVILVFLLLPQNLKKYFLLISSYVFYMSWKAEYILLIIYSTLIDYFCGLLLERTNESLKRKLILGISIFSNLGLLFVFKYFNFFYVSVFNFSTEPLLNLFLPVGISFYTFQTMSYTIDVYYKNQKAEKSFVNFATYVTYFPQLVAGPIERPQNLLGQFKEKYSFNYSNFRIGFRMILWGVFKKVAVADNISKYVDAVFDNSANHESFALIVGAYLFSLQIYCDFSGYSDIAIGVSKLFNIDLMKNFQTPYLSKSISEFWRRWHISLSSWFRDYLYIPLGGGRVQKYRVYFNLFITFLISGFWHGANWTFIVWGGIHGFFICIDKIIKKPINVPSFIKIFVTANIAVFAFIFFRSNDLSHSLLYISKILEFEFNQFYEVKSLVRFSIPVFILLGIDFCLKLKSFDELMNNIKSSVIRKILYSFLILTIIHFGNFYSENFIYFQF